MKPENVAKNPIIKSRYLAFNNRNNDLWFLSISSFLRHSQAENPNKIKPCPISPNIIPKRKGYVTILKAVGFTSL